MSKADEFTRLIDGTPEESEEIKKALFTKRDMRRARKVVRNGI